MSYNLIIERPVVVLPQPDSPTRPNVSPFLISKLTFMTLSPTTAITKSLGCSGKMIRNIQVIMNTMYI